jgi:EmrB/QacA subfamily drug resistance transporter
MSDNITTTEKSHHTSKWIILAAVMTGVIMGPIDGSIVNVVLPAISRDLHCDYSVVQWIPTIYLLAVCSFILAYGRLGDMLGYKKIFLIGLASFAIASLLCGFSQNIWMLIVFRAIQGLTVSMQMALGLAIITSAFPVQERGKAVGIYGTAIAAGLMLGPVLGGVIAEYLNWHYVFFINVPIAVGAFTWGVRVIPSGVRKPSQRLDFYGAVMAFIFLFSIVLYVNRGRDWGWFSPECIIVLVIAIIFGAAFIITERRLAQPMLNLSLFRSRRFGFACMSALISFMALYTQVFLTPWYLSDGLGYSVLGVGLVMLASPIVTFFIGPISGTLSDRIGVRGLAFCGMVINAVGLFMLSQLDASAGSFDVGWRLAICGLGSGMFMSPINSAIMGSVPPWHRGIASSILAAMRNTGMAFGIAIAGAIVYNLAPATTSGHIGVFTGNELDAFLNGLHWAYIGGAALALTAGLIALMAVVRNGTETSDISSGNQ